jgi:hypothetical protein
MTHYKRWQVHGDPLIVKTPRPRTKNTGPCSIEGCETIAQARNYCGKHYARWLRYGDPHAVKLPIRTGKPYRRPDGYVYIYWPEHPNASSKSVGQHTVVMTEYLGRPLHKGETVHHKNGVRDDNRLENLELWVRSHPPGQRVSELIGWAHELLERYKDDFQLWPEGLQP